MKPKLTHLLAVLSLSLASPVLAQSIVGSAMVDGKTVNLFDDGTWASPPATTLDGDAECVALHPQIQFCGDPLIWRSERSVGDFDRLFSLGETTFAGVILEPFGRADNVNPDFMRTMALDNAAEASGISTKDVPVLGLETQEFDGYEAETMAYGARINGVGVVYANSFIIFDHLTVQAVVWEIGEEYSDDHRARTESFLNSLSFTSGKADQ